MYQVIPDSHYKTAIEKLYAYGGLTGNRRCGEPCLIDFKLGDEYLDTFLHRLSLEVLAIDPKLRLPDRIISKLQDLHKQATTEKSHYYTAACIQEAITELARLKHFELLFEAIDNRSINLTFSIEYHENHSASKWVAHSGAGNFTNGVGGTPLEALRDFYNKNDLPI